MTDFELHTADIKSEKGLLPRIVPFNAQNLVPSRYVDIRPQLVGWDVTTADGVRTGRNERFRGLIGPGTTDDRFVWYAGLVTATRCSKTAAGQNAAGENFPECTGDNLGKRYTVFKPVPFGAVPLSSFADVVEHGSEGLVGTLVVEPAGARHTDPTTLRFRCCRRREPASPRCGPGGKRWPRPSTSTP